MRYLNLTPGFNPYGSVEHNTIEFTTSVFPGGEVNFRLESNPWDDGENIHISIRLNSWQDMGLLLSAVYAIDQQGDVGDVALSIPYFPGARQDRVCNKGEALTVKIYTDILNESAFSLVRIFDPHSDVTPALIDNCEVINNYDFIRAVDTDLSLEDFYIVSPDAGANKKVVDLCKACGFEALVKCDKERDLATGKLSGFTVYADDLKGRPCLIVDDICDGGGTFIGLAEELKKKNAGDLYLAVSHGIFSKGFDVLSKHFKGIYTTDSICSTYQSKLVKVINLNQL